ncbi:MAG TPA: ATP-binding protein [Anaerolineales bacterium]|nr:ATP-binding protein [Anaerolineales bacterium]
MSIFEKVKSGIQSLFPNRSLAIKLVLSFLAVSLAGIALIGVLASNVSAHEFGRFVNTQRPTSLATSLTDYYAEHNGWNGVETIIQSDNTTIATDTIRPIVLVDNHGNVVFSTDSQFQNQKPSADQVAFGVPIWAGGQIVGLLIPTFPPRGAAPRPPANDYIARINEDLLVGVLGAVALSLLLGLFFSSTLTRPLKDLINATRDVAQGNLEREVPVRSKDELGDLTKSFNQMSSQLKQSRDLRRNMTADIAHELRTPLSIILGHTEALSEGKLAPSPETFDIVYDEAKRLSLLVEDLRTLSLSEAGELTLTLQPVSPTDLIDRVAGAYLPKARSAGISLETDADANLPDINADSHRIIQVFGNLLENALRYAPSGGHIRLSGRSVPDGIEFRVQDSGPGIPEVDLPHIFDRFYRGDKSRSRQDGGSGLGLAISKSIIQAHGGRIWAESEPSEGTTIVFILPAFKNLQP